MQPDQNPTPDAHYSTPPLSWWRNMPCGHPPEPVAWWIVPDGPTCHCGRILDSTAGYEDPASGAPGPLVRCGECDCRVAISPKPAPSPSLPDSGEREALWAWRWADEDLSRSRRWQTLDEDAVEVMQRTPALYEVRRFVATDSAPSSSPSDGEGDEAIERAIRSSKEVAPGEPLWAGELEQHRRFLAALPSRVAGEAAAVRVLLGALIEIRGLGARPYDTTTEAAKQRTAEAALLAFEAEGGPLLDVAKDDWTPNDGTRLRLGEAQQAVNEMEREVQYLRAQINDKGAGHGDVPELPEAEGDRDRVVRAAAGTERGRPLRGGHHAPGVRAGDETELTPAPVPTDGEGQDAPARVETYQPFERTPEQRQAAIRDAVTQVDVPATEDGSDERTLDKLLEIADEAASLDPRARGVTDKEVVLNIVEEIAADRGISTAELDDSDRAEIVRAYRDGGDEE